MLKYRRKKIQISETGGPLTLFINPHVAIKKGRLDINILQIDRIYIFSLQIGHFYTYTVVSNQKINIPVKY